MTDQMLPQFSTDDNGLMHFTFNGTEVRVGLLDNGEPYFVAADLAKVLHLTNIRPLMSRIKDTHKGVTNVYTPSGVQQMAVVDEPGLYKLIFSSRAEKAEELQDLVFEKILPAIRKQGAYISPSISDEQLSALTQEIDRLRALDKFQKQMLASAETARRALMGGSWADYSDPDKD